MRSMKQEMIEMLGRLRPHRAHGCAKVRLGSSHDGGYVLLDDFAGIERAIGCGVGTNADFERDLARKGIPVELFDHTIDAVPYPHPLFTFHRRPVRAATPGDGDAIDLAGFVSLHALKPDSAVLKLDIEGDEWALLQHAPRQALLPWRQIVVELHWLDKASDAKWRACALAAMENVTRDFAVVHVHANNHSPMVSLDGLLVPMVLEISLARRRRYRLRRSDEEFPTALDTPNDNRKPDFRLGRFDFGDRLTARLWRRLSGQGGHQT